MPRAGTKLTALRAKVARNTSWVARAGNGRSTKAAPLQRGACKVEALENDPFDLSLTSTNRQVNVPDRVSVEASEAMARPSGRRQCFSSTDLLKLS